jgi:hypothetical protein
MQEWVVSSGYDNVVRQLQARASREGGVAMDCMGYELQSHARVLYWIPVTVVHFSDNYTLIKVR